MATHSYNTTMLWSASIDNDCSCGCYQTSGRGERKSLRHMTKYAHQCCHPKDKLRECRQSQSRECSNNIPHPGRQRATQGPDWVLVGTSPTLPSTPPKAGGAVCYISPRKKRECGQGIG